MSIYNRMSFLIPALNEEKDIGKTICSIREHVPKHIEYEIVVGDHGSVDKTRNIAESFGASVFKKSGSSIASLRNDLARAASGDLLIFNDADVLLTSDWGNSIRDVIGEIEGANGTRLVGGLLQPSQQKNWLIDNWFRLQKLEEKQYAGTGHLIIPKKLLDDLNGFNENLASGEDYDLSMRAKDKGVKVYVDERLRVIHTDYPTTLKDFYYRELWHGTGDFKDIGSLIKSKVAMTSVIFIFAIIALLSNYFVVNKYAALSGLIALSIPVGCSYWKFNSLDIKQRAVNVMIWVIYLTARALSFFYRKNNGRLNIEKV